MHQTYLLGKIKDWFCDKKTLKSHLLLCRVTAAPLHFITFNFLAFAKPRLLRHVHLIPGHQRMGFSLILIGAAALTPLEYGTQLSTTTALGRMQCQFQNIATIQLIICEIILGYTQSYCGILTIATQETYTAERDLLMVSLFHNSISWINLKMKKYNF